MSRLVLRLQMWQYYMIFPFLKPFGSLRTYVHTMIDQVKGGLLYSILPASSSFEYPRTLSVCYIQSITLFSPGLKHWAYSESSEESVELLSKSLPQSQEYSHRRRQPRAKKVIPRHGAPRFAVLISNGSSVSFGKRKKQRESKGRGSYAVGVRSQG